jgi:hypothetical protein
MSVSGGLKNSGSGGGVSSRQRRLKSVRRDLRNIESGSESGGGVGVSKVCYNRVSRA